MIVGNYREKEGRWCSKALRESYGVGLWKAIQSKWKAFNKKVGFRVGNGRKVRFWQDKWCGEEP